MKKLFTKLAMILMFSAASSYGTHLAGGYITYTHISQNNYMLHLVVFRDCSSGTATMPTSAQVCYSSVSTAFASSLTLTLDSSFQVPYNTCASIANVVCNTGFVYAYEKYFYSGICTLPALASDWVFGFELCCRNGAITTIANPLTYGMYVESKLDNLTYPVNSSPDFNSTQFSLYCAGIFTNIDYSVTDADGDSVVYTLDPVVDATFGCPMTPVIPLLYVPPFSPTYPMSSFTPVTLNPTTGIFSFTPSTIQVGVVSMVISEYRNGVLIGSIKRDDQIPVVAGIQNPDIAEGTVYYDVNANGIYDAGENPAVGKIVQAQTNLSSITDIAGLYHFDLIPGSYTISAPVIPYYNVVPSSHSVSFTALGQASTGNDFACQPIPGITDLSLSLTMSPVLLPGGTTTLNLHVVNNGTVTVGGNLGLNYDVIYQYISSSAPPSVTTAGYLEWSIAPLLPGGIQDIYATFEVSASAPLGNSYVFDGSIPAANDTTPADNNDSFSQLIAASFDPNEKYVEPNQPLTPAFFANSEYLTYTVAFQNTGNANAQNVVIYDPLDLLLDKSTLIFEGASHNCLVELDANSPLTFRFNNINLPPAFINEPLSHGYVSFKVKPVSNMQQGQSILNSAGIVFDSNAPIFTNYVVTSYPQVTSIQESPNPAINGVVYPNPASGFVSVSVKEPGEFNVELIDLAGRTVASKAFNNYTIINTDNISNGVYIFRIHNTEAGTLSGKIVIVR